MRRAFRTSFEADFHSHEGIVIGENPPVRSASERDYFGILVMLYNAFHMILLILTALFSAEMFFHKIPKLLIRNARLAAGKQEGFLRGDVKVNAVLFPEGLAG